MFIATTFVLSILLFVWLNGYILHVHSLFSETFLALPMSAVVAVSPHKWVVVVVLPLVDRVTPFQPFGWTFVQYFGAGILLMVF